MANTPPVRAAETPDTTSATPEFAYLNGFGNEHQSEALPADQNSPQRASCGPHAEQLSASAYHRTASGQPA